jgi:hypothetical protein
MVEQTPHTVTEATTPAVGLSLEQRYFGACATFDMTRDSVMPLIEDFLLNGKKGEKPTGEVKAAMERLQGLAQLAQDLFEELRKESKDGELMFRYAQLGVELASHRARCYRAGFDEGLNIQAKQAGQAKRGEKLDPPEPVNIEEMASGAWLWVGARNISATLIDALKDVEIQLIAKGYRTISIEDFDQTARVDRPFLIHSHLFRKRDKNEKPVNHALTMRREHSALQHIVGKKPSAVAKKQARRTSRTSP